MYKIFPLASLSTISRNKNVGLRHDLTKDFSHLRVSCTYNSADIAVRTSHAFLSPLIYLFAYQFIQRTSVDKTVLELAAGRIGGLHQDKEPLLLFLTYIDKRLYSIRAKIRIDRYEILVKGRISLAAHLNFSDMPCCISCGSGADISPLNISNNYQTFFFAVIYCLFKSHQSRNTELFIHGNLRLYSRNKIPCLVHDLFVKLPDRLCGAFQRLPKFRESFCFHLFRNISKHGIQAYYNRCSCFFYFSYQFINQ